MVILYQHEVFQEINDERGSFFWAFLSTDVEDGERWIIQAPCSLD
jgi:hypothetical protein